MLTRGMTMQESIQSATSKCHERTDAMDHQDIGFLNLNDAEIP